MTSEQFDWFVQKLVESCPRELLARMGFGEAALHG
jgi:hypothetical protein